jgi:UDP-glucose 4-epimerase
MSRLLVTGSAGFIGRPTVVALRKLGHEVFTLDIHGDAKDNFSVDIVDADLEDIFQEVKPQAVIHLAAQVNVSDSFQDPIRDIEVNGIGTIRLVLASVKSGCKNFIYVGSGGAIYDSTTRMPLTEDSLENPVSPYGLSKRIGEGYVRILSEKYGTGWTSLALSNCYGPVLEHGRGVIFQFWNAISHGKKPFINGADVTRDFIYIDDVVRAIVLSIAEPINQRINISSATEVSLLDLYKNVQKVMGSNVEPEIRAPLFGDVLRSCLSNTKAMNFLKWSPEIDLADGLVRCLVKSDNH